MDIKRAKVEAINYIKHAKYLKTATDRNFWGRLHWSALSGASYVILPFRQQLRPYAMLILAITKRWREEEAERPLLTKRQKYRLGKMTPEEASIYERDCRWTRSREEKLFAA